MKKALVGLFTLFLLVGWISGQSTTVSGIVTDQSSQVWVGGTISYTFQPISGFAGKYQWQGADLPSNYLTATQVTLDGTGAFSFSLPSNTAITPAGTTWNFRVCPQATTACTSLQLPITGTSQSISSSITAVLPGIVINPVLLPNAYSDSEVQSTVGQGSAYLNTTTGEPRYSEGGTFHNFAGSITPGCIGDCVLTDPTVTQAITQPVNTNLIVNTSGTGVFASTNTNGTLNEMLFSGATITDRINTAITACGTAPCVITIPPNEAAGSYTPPFAFNNVIVRDQRFINGIGFANNSSPNFRAAITEYLYNGADRSFESSGGPSAQSGVLLHDLECGNTAGGTAHDGTKSNSVCLGIVTGRSGGNRPVWAQNSNIQYSNFNNTAIGLEIDLGNNVGSDDPGDGTAGVGIELVGGTNTNSRSGIGLFMVGEGGQSNAGFTTDINLNGYRDTGISLNSTSTKLADIAVGVLDTDPTKASLAVTSSTIANGQFVVYDSGDATGQNFRGLNFRAIGPINATLQGQQVGFNFNGTQEMDFLNWHVGGTNGGWNFYSTTSGSIAGAVATISAAGQVHGSTLVSDGQVFATGVQVGGSPGVSFTATLTNCTIVFQGGIAISHTGSACP